METPYFSIPQSFTNIVQGKKLEKITLEQSVRQHLNLIIMTRVGSYRYDENYGSIILEKDFEATIYTSTANWCSVIQTQLSEVVQYYEKRLKIESNGLRVEEYRSENKTEKSIQIIIKGELIDFHNTELEIKFLMSVSPILSLTVL